MFNKSKTIGHLTKARRAVMEGDHASGMHHVGHALASLRGAQRNPLSPDDGDDSKMTEPKNFIAGATKNKGALHRNLGVPQGKKIPAAKIDAAANSNNPKIAKEASLAKTLRSFNRKGK